MSRDPEVLLAPGDLKVPLGTAGGWALKDLAARLDLRVRPVLRVPSATLVRKARAVAQVTWVLKVRSVSLDQEVRPAQRVR